MFLIDKFALRLNLRYYCARRKSAPRTQKVGRKIEILLPPFFEVENGISKNDYNLCLWWMRTYC